MPTVSEKTETVRATCPECQAKHDIPRIEIKGYIMKRVLCPKCDAEDKAARRAGEDAAQAKARAARERLWESICPPLYRDTDTARLPQAEAAKVLAWQHGARGLLLVGPPRSGKTRTMYMLLHRLLAEGKDIRAFDCLDFDHTVCRIFSAPGQAVDWLDALAQADVVALDDVGKGSITPRVEAELFGLIERRMAHLRPIIATLNMTGKDLIAKLSADRGAALVGRLRECCEIVVFPEKKGVKP